MSERRDAAASDRSIAFRSARMPSRMRRSGSMGQSREVCHFEQLDHPGSEAIPVDRPDLEAVNLEQPSDGALDLQLWSDELQPGGKGRAHRLRRRRLDVYRPIMAQAHHFGDAASVVLICLDGARGQEALGMAHLNTHDRYAGLAKRLMKPLWQWTGFDSGERDITGPLGKSFNEGLWLARHLALPQHSAIAVNGTHRRFGEWHVKPYENTHATSY
jgi:hypothetical protein